MREKRGFETQTATQPKHYLLEVRKQRQNSDPFEVMFFWTKEVPWVRFGGWKKNSVGAAPKGGVFLYSVQITSKGGVTNSPRHGDEKSFWGSCSKKFSSRDIQLQSWKFPKIGVLRPLPSASFMNWGSKFYFCIKIHTKVTRIYISLFIFRSAIRRYRFLKISKIVFERFQK
jgi:hypothetical protein